MSERPLRVGLVINPLAGLGGSVALKGSDGMAEVAVARGAVPKVYDRVKTCLASLQSHPELEGRINWYAMAGVMGSDLLTDSGLKHEVVGHLESASTSAANTRAAVSQFELRNIDLLLFAGGDGTARDVLDALDTIPAVIGLPSGVKMHSGVFANTPRAAAALLTDMAMGRMLSVIPGEVRDIDEASFRDGVVKTRFYGELPVPDDLQYMQQTKIGGREVEELVIEEIAADFIQQQEPETNYLMGSGSTVAGVMRAMGLEATLLGIDVVRNGQLISSDATEAELLTLLNDGRPAKILVTAISGQGHVFGRGNQQLSASVIRRVGAENIVIVASKSKLETLDGRSLLVDSGDPEIDDLLSGVRSIVTGFEDRVLYRVSS